LEQLLVGRDPNEVFAKDGLLDDLKKALSERLLNAELDEHIENERANGNVNRRNGGTVGNSVREAMMMERSESSHGYREGTSGPIACGPRSERGVCQGRIAR